MECNGCNRRLLIRYHKFRKVHGKLFVRQTAQGGTRLTYPHSGLRHLRAFALRQGRYKSLIVEQSNYLGSLLHYVHLNPVRAGMVTAESLRDYRWSSFWYLLRANLRRTKIAKLVA